ncbi:hypothetical protein PHIM7_297 [Sinorhizobium phage phiM7]|uniref:Uncharacterized protein n=2 Tax=Emdodecavirus TaxID=1980937 RepID=S5M7H6_9CAUD|nr:hypothetical protein AB690_gp214 [Sinorhizobium phage phiM12]YP_009601422.1 hypothetical protein FDH46_gp181 [Sinorhizobium phage phiM7]AGR48016.1 hypothetical protein SmphiM12_384 [Sinorhizobium phage phiM12]AKF12843.1 hypothetical protein PHIM7_297 [Sinorhizobium phage phiM7]AKF13202.1 hypothetical protein PHIM19_297 [Sinorhizobium phage phiM19]
MKKKTQQFAWLFDRLNKAGRFTCETRNGVVYPEHWATWGLSVGSFYDRDTELLTDFIENFPGRKEDDYENGKKRLGKLLSELYHDGWIDRSIRGNQLEYIGEGQRWAYVYTMPAVYAKKILEGKLTPEEMARQYQGDRT